MHRILLDQNLSPRLRAKLSDLFPGLESVYDHSLVGASDTSIFAWARMMEFSALITADHDLVELAERRGRPPGVIRIEHCDYPSGVIATLIRREAVRISSFLDSHQPVLILRL